MIALVAIAHLLGAGTAAAQDEGYGVTADVERPLPIGAGDDPTASATEVEIRDRPQAFDTADDLVHEVPGAQAWVTGAYGAFSALSIRGAGAEHTTVLLGDLPLGAEGEPFDLSLVPVSLLERIEVYRGGAPVWLGAGGIGGVLRLVPREDTRSMAEIAAGAGSYGLYHGRIATSVVGERGVPSWTAAAGFVHSDGDFPFRYDPTELVPGDERELRRTNGHVDEGHGLVRFTAPAARGTLEAVLLGVGRNAGVTGPAIQVSRASRALARLAGVVAFSSEAEDGSWRARVSAGAGYERDALADRFGEIGFGRPRVTDDRSDRVHALGALEVRVLPWLGAGAVVRLGREGREPNDARAGERVPPSQRWSGSVAGEARLHGRIDGTRIEGRPSARLRLARSTLHEIAGGREGQEVESTHAAPTFRLGAIVEPWRGVGFVGSIAHETRLPTFVELFGDRAFLLGDTRLRQERALTADAGVLLRGASGVVRGTVEARGFVVVAEDLIRYRRTAQSQALPENVARARSTGIELGVRGEAGRHVGMVASLTWLEATDRGLDRRLPLRPTVQGYVRPSLQLFGIGPLSRLVLWTDATYGGGTFADPHNLIAIPARLLFGAGIVAELVSGALSIALSGSDLGDVRPSDVLGFPMPGRSVALTVTGRTEAW